MEKIDQQPETALENIDYFNIKASAIDQVFFLIFLICSSVFIIILYMYSLWLCKDTGMRTDVERQTVSKELYFEYE